MTNIQRILLEAVAGIVLIIGTVLYLEHRGAAQCKADDKLLVTKAETHNDEVETTEKVEDTKAKDKLDATLNSPLGALPSVASLQPTSCPSTVPVARSHSSAGAQATVARAEPAPSVVPEGWDTFERFDVQSAKDGDAQITYLQTLLVNQYKLCGGK